MTSAHEKAIESMAKALHCGLFPELRDKSDWPALSEKRRDNYRKIAMLVIRAEQDAMLEAEWKMTPRTPTKEMCLSGGILSSGVEKKWPAMWDAAPHPGEGNDASSKMEQLEHENARLRQIEDAARRFIQACHEGAYIGEMQHNLEECLGFEPEADAHG